MYTYTSRFLIYKINFAKLKNLNGYTRKNKVHRKLYPTNW